MIIKKDSDLTHKNEIFIEEDNNMSSYKKENKIISIICISIFVCFCFFAYSFQKSFHEEKHSLHKITTKASPSLILKNWYEN